MFNSFFTKFNWRIPLIFGLALLCAVPVQAGEFRYNSTTRAIEIKGTFHLGDERKFRALLRTHPETRTVKLLSSVGGEYTSALEISLAVKRAGLNTIAAGYCHSGCAYIWLAGASRAVVGADAPKIHMPYANATGEAYPHLTYAWLEALGLSAGFADAAVQSVGPDNRFVRLTPAFLKQFGGFTRRAA